MCDRKALVLYWTCRICSSVSGHALNTQSHSRRFLPSKSGSADDPQSLAVAVLIAAETPLQPVAMAAASFLDAYSFHARPSGLEVPALTTVFC